MAALDHRSLPARHRGRPLERVHLAVASGQAGRAAGTAARLVGPQAQRPPHNPNDEDLDPDIGIAVLAFHRRPGPRQTRPGPGDRPLPGVPVLPVAVAGGRPPAPGQHQVRRPGLGRANTVEGLLLVVLLVVYVTVLVVVLTPVQALAFVVVQQGLFGLYLGCAFAPNHKGMPTLTQADQLDFLRRQVLTSRNVRGSRMVDYVLGGLNYQIEHHLFPTMPRPNLRRAQPLIRDFRRHHNLPFTEASLVGSYTQALRHLHTVSAPLRPVRTAAD